MASAQYLDFGVPWPPSPASSSGSFETFALDGSGDRIAWTFTPEDALTITALAAPIGSRTGTPPTYRISLQGVDASGNPDGVVLGGGSPASATFTPPADATWNNTIQWITLSNSFTVTRGTVYAIVIDHSSGSVDGSNFTTINNGHTNIGARSGNVIAQQYGGASWSKRNIWPVFGYRTASRSYGWPAQTFFSTTFSSDTASGSGGDERGMKFTLPAGWGATFKIRGIRWIGNMSATGKTITATLYTGTTVLQDVTIDSDTAQGTGNYMTFTAMFDESSLTALDFGSSYYVAIKPNETASSLGIFGISVAEAQDRKCFGFGTDSLWAFRTDSGSWDETVTTRVPLIWLILDDITEPSGGGGTIGRGLIDGLLVRA